MSTNKTIAPVLADKIPEFAKDLYPRFVQFMRDYIDFLEQDENFLRIALDWQHNLEPSNNVEPYIDALLKDLGFESGQNLAVDKHLMLHLLRDFYLARGSEASFKFLFRALFNEDVSLHYPREQLLVPSYASYGERHFIFTSANNRGSEQYQSLVNYIVENGGTLTGVSTGVKASIENVVIQHGSGSPYLRIEILYPNFEFDVNEGVLIEGGTFAIAETIKPVMAIKVVDGGSGYLAGDHVSVIGPSLQGEIEIDAVSAGGLSGFIPSGTGWSVGDRIRAYPQDGGFGFSATVTSVSGQGAITDYNVTHSGYNYTVIPPLSSATNPIILQGVSDDIGGIQSIRTLSPYVDFTSCTFVISSENGTGAVLEARPVSRWSTSEWSDEKGFIGVNSTLIDSDKYQQYSYTIVSSIASNNYDSFVTDLLHPAGYVKTNSYEIVSHLSLELTTTDIQVNQVVGFEYDSTLLLEFEAELEFEAANVMIASTGIELVTNLDDEILISQ